MPGRVLVLGDDTRSFLTIVRSLGRRGVEVHVAPTNFRSPALRSRYIHTVHRLPIWSGEGAEWLSAVEELLRAVRFDMVIPCNETALLPLYRHSDRFAGLARLGIPNAEAIEAFFDKHSTRELARSVGVTVPPGRLLRADDEADAVVAELGLPVVVKPRQSYRFEKLHRRGKVRVVDTVAGLAALLPTLEPDDTLLEGFHPGVGLGVSVLAHEGRVLQGFEHHRVREIEGASYYRVSAALDPALSAAVAAMVRAVRFSGIAMFEFKRSPSAGRGDDWILLEVNARPWGSMPLPVALGVDFPWRWYRQVVAGEISSPQPYRAGVYGRNLVPDLWAMRAEAGSRSGLAGRVRHVAGRLWDMHRVLAGREKQDVFVWDDPRPAFEEGRQVVAEVVARVATRVPGYSRWAGSRARSIVRRSRGKDGAVLFVCHGNICRSPFAELAFKRMVDPSMQVGSYGTMPVPGRPSPGLAVAAASRRGIDLSLHGSRLLTWSEADAASVILIFDDKNRRAVLDEFPFVDAKLVLLSDLIGVGEIIDPVDGDAEVFDAVYAEIERGVRAMATVMR